MRRSLPINRATPTRKLIRKSVSAKDIRFLSERVTLEHVLGLTTTNNNGLTCNPDNGIIAYPAGCVIVLYNPRTNCQRHIFSPEKKTLTALAFSSDGKYIASGESGHNPRVRVWELGETVTQVAELNGHKFSINCVAFSPNLKYLVSIGDQHDMLVNIWNWRSGTKVACNKIGCKVRSVSFAENGSYFVTVGNRHVKFWYFDTEVGSKSNVPTPVAGRSGILGELRNNCFCDVKCGIGDNATNTYAVTKSGLLCSFNEKRILDRWVELRSSGASSLSVNEKYIFCGCADGIIRVFHPTTMHFISSLPKPHFLGVNVADGLDASHMVSKDSNVRYPHVVSLALDDGNDKLSVVYNDHSLYIWDVHDVKKVGKACSFLYHSACIWGLETYPLMSEELHPCLPAGSFLTCSSDDTIRVWNIDDDVALNNTFPKNIYSKELLKIIYTDEDLANIQDISSIPISTSSDMKTGVRCLQVSPDGQLLAAGDRSGNLRVYDLQFVVEIMKIEAHEAEILCVEFSDPKSGYRLLATSSRDRLIHIFDIDKDFTLIQTIDDHASSVTAVRFNFDDGVFQLLSCGADKHILLHTSQQFEDRNGMHFVRENTIAVGKATLYDMDIDPTRKLATTCGQDRNVRVYDIQSVKQTHCYKGAVSEDGTLIKIQLDPSGLYAATSCSDKSVNIYDFEAGECAAVMYGHSELVTGLKFTRDGTRLISVSGDHCIFVWRLASVFTQAIITRLEDLGMPIPESMKNINDPVSALRNTFIIPKARKEGMHDVIEEEFSIADPAIFEKDVASDPAGQFDYRFSVGQLPAWAQKQITGEKDNGEGNSAFGVSHPSGRWAQRVTAAPMVLTAALAEKTISMDNTTSTDRETTRISESRLMSATESAGDASDLKQGLPYSSHDYSSVRRPDNVIYIPSNGEELDAEISSFQVTARSSVKAKKLSADMSQKENFSELVKTEDQQEIGNDAAVIDYDSLDEEEEEDEDESCDSENLPSEHDDADDSVQSPLEQHFEYLAEDEDEENEKEDTYHVNATHGNDVKHKKGQSFLSRCRSSISAKFLSRSQKSQGGKSSQLSEEQRKRIDSFKRVIDQNQNYGGPPTRSMNSKEAKRVKKLTAKSEPNLSLGIPPVGKASGSSPRRGSGRTVESHLDLRSIKEGKISEDLQSKDRVRHLRGGSTSSTSPTERERSTSDLINMFHQRSSTPKQKMDLPLNSPLVNSKGNRTSSSRSPGMSPVSSPVKAKLGLSHDKVTNHRQSESTTRSDVRRRPKKQGDRPRLHKRPKSLVITSQVSLEDMIQDHFSHVHSDTEIDDECKLQRISKNQSFAIEEKPVRKVQHPIVAKSEFVSASLIVRDIDIDDSAKSDNSRRSWMCDTVIAADQRPNELVPSEDATLADVGLKLGEDAGGNTENIGKDDQISNLKTVPAVEEAGHSLVKHPKDETLNQGDDCVVTREVELNVDATEEQPAEAQREDAALVVADEDTIKECKSAIDEIKKSFQALSNFQEKTLSMGDGNAKSKLVGLLSDAYTSLLENAREHKDELERGLSSTWNEGLDKEAKRVASLMDSNHIESDKTVQVMNLLENYSDAIVKLVQSKLNGQR